MSLAALVKTGLKQRIETTALLSMTVILMGVCLNPETSAMSIDFLCDLMYFLNFAFY